MKRIITLIGLALGTASFGQVVFQSDLSSWSMGDPTDWMGSTTSIASANVVEQTVGTTYGTSMASLVNATASHVRFTTVSTPVTAGETYEIKMWVAASVGELRTNFYDVTNAAYGTYNPYFDLSTESGGSLVMLSQTVTVPSTCTNAEFIISVRNTDPATAAFGIGIVIDSVSVSVTTPPVSSVVSIYDIQYTTDPSGDSPEAGNLVTTRGVVTGVINVGAATGTFFIQDGDGPYTGIYVYETGTAVALGDSVFVTGTVTEYFTYTEFTAVSDITIINSGNPLPTPADVSTAGIADEQYESVMVKVSDAICTNADAGFGQFQVNDGSGIALVDDDIFSYTPILGNGYEITGVNHFSFDEYKILPRTISDINTVGFAGLNEFDNNISVYPNPATENITISGTLNNTVTIFALDGSVVYKGTNVSTISVGEFEAGVYMVNISTADKTFVEKLIVR